MKERDFDDDGFIDTLQELIDNMLESDGFLNLSQKTLFRKYQDMLEAEKRGKPFSPAQKGRSVPLVPLRKQECEKKHLKRTGKK